MLVDGTCLQAAFVGNIWGHTGVGEIACKNTTQHALGVVGIG